MEASRSIPKCFGPEPSIWAKMRIGFAGITFPSLAELLHHPAQSLVMPVLDLDPAIAAAARLAAVANLPRPRRSDCASVRQEIGGSPCPRATARVSQALGTNHATSRRPSGNAVTSIRKPDARHTLDDEADPADTLPAFEHRIKISLCILLQRCSKADAFLLKSWPENHRLH